MIQPSMLRTATAPVEVRVSDDPEVPVVGWVGWEVEGGGEEVRGGSMSISVVVVIVAIVVMGGVVVVRSGCGGSIESWKR